MRSARTPALLKSFHRQPESQLLSRFFFFSPLLLRRPMRWHRGVSASSRLSQLSLLFIRVLGAVPRLPRPLQASVLWPSPTLRSPAPSLPSPSDWLRQPLPAWVKSPGPRWKGQTRGLFPLTEASVCSQWKLMTSAASRSRRCRHSLRTTSDGEQPQPPLLPFTAA